MVQHNGNFDFWGSPYKLLAQENPEHDVYLSTLLAPGDESPNQVLRYLIGVTEVQSFVEKVPTMNDIFISLVKGGDHE